MSLGVEYRENRSNLANCFQSNNYYYGNYSRIFHQLFHQWWKRLDEGKEENKTRDFRHCARLV